MGLMGRTQQRRWPHERCVDYYAHRERVDEVRRDERARAFDWAIKWVQDLGADGAVEVMSHFCSTGDSYLQEKGLMDALKGKSMAEMFQVARERGLIE